MGGEEEEWEGKWRKSVSNGREKKDGWEGKRRKEN